MTNSRAAGPSIRLAFSFLSLGFFAYGFQSIHCDLVGEQLPSGLEHILVNHLLIALGAAQRLKPEGEVALTIQIG